METCVFWYITKKPKYIGDELNMSLIVMAQLWSITIRETIFLRLWILQKSSVLLKLIIQRYFFDRMSFKT